jgi:hypothetical protein
LEGGNPAVKGNTSMIVLAVVLAVALCLSGTALEII